MCFFGGLLFFLSFVFVCLLLLFVFCWCFFGGRLRLGRGWVLLCLGSFFGGCFCFVFVRLFIFFVIVFFNVCVGLGLFCTQCYRPI